MPASQLETGVGMVEGGRLPGCGDMTGRTICTKNACMGVFGLVAGITVFGCANKYIIKMARAAGSIDMHSGQWERRKIVIECRRFPSGRGVT